MIYEGLTQRSGNGRWFQLQNTEKHSLICFEKCPKIPVSLAVVLVKTSTILFSWSLI